MNIQDIYNNVPQYLRGNMNVFGSATPASGTGTGNLTGATPTGYTAASGGIPQMPSPQATQSAAIAGNVASLPQLQSLAGNVNQFNLGQVRGQYEAGIPNYNAMTNKSSANILAALSGQLPRDVIQQMQQRGAERGIATGLSGSDAANAAYLRALGLTSLGQTQYGETALSNAVSRMPRTGLYDVSSQFINPQQQQEAQYMANVLASAAIPQEAYNQALWASMMGQNRGYNSARNYGNTGFINPSATPAASIANKYNPAGTGSGIDPYAIAPDKGVGKPGYGELTDLATGQTWYGSSNATSPVGGAVPDVTYGGATGGPYNPTGNIPPGAFVNLSSNPLATSENPWYVPTDNEWDAMGDIYGVTGPDMVNWYYDEAYQ